MTGAALDGWTPVGLLWEGDRPMVDWRQCRGVRFTDPFFDMTIERAMRHPFRLLFGRRTGIEVLEERAATHPGIPPTGFIFHMSRCGSTLIAQMLAASDGNVVISEGWALDSVIDADAWQPGVTAADRRRWLRAMIPALAQPRLGTERRFFIKFDARHATDLPLIQSAFPGVPWVFVYRDPVEVLVSHFAEPTLWTEPGIVPVRGLPWPPLSGGQDPDAYPAAVIACICHAAINALEDGGLLLNYDELPGAVFSKLASHFGCRWFPEELDVMRSAATRNAKRPEEAFVPDSRRKQREASPRIREICEGLLGDLYRRLEARRAHPHAELH
jgi:hypothetical protein